MSVRPSTATPGLGVALVGQDPMEPGLEAVGVAQRSKLAPGRDERGLHRVLGQVGIAQDPVRDGHAPVADRACEGVEGLARRPVCARSTSARCTRFSFPLAIGPGGRDHTEEGSTRVKGSIPPTMPVTIPEVTPGDPLPTTVHDPEARPWTTRQHSRPTSTTSGSSDPAGDSTTRARRSSTRVWPSISHCRTRGARRSPLGERSDGDLSAGSTTPSRGRRVAPTARIV